MCTSVAQWSELFIFMLLYQGTIKHDYSLLIHNNSYTFKFQDAFANPVVEFKHSNLINPGNVLVSKFVFIDLLYI